MTRTSSLAATLLLAALTGTASADPAGGFQPAMDEHGYLSVDASQTLGNTELSFGLGSLAWGHHLQDPTTMATTDDAMTATLVGALGLRLGPLPVELGVSVPLSVTTGTTTEGQGLGDVGAHVKAQLLDSTKHVVGAAVIARAYLPTASGTNAMPGDRVIPEVDAVLDAGFGRLRVAVNAGARWREEMGGTQIPVGAAAALAIAPHKFELIGEVSRALNAPVDNLSALGGVKVYLANASYLTLGAGRGLTETGASDVRAMIGIVFEPRAPQVASAHIPDDPGPIVVAPPRTPDPAPQRDNDTTPDGLQSCAAEPDAVGCVDLSEVVDTGSTLVMLKPINFEFDKAVIKPDSFSILDAVARSLVENADIKKVEIGGHTDERGDEMYNLDLSDRRAAAVRTYLTAHGVAADRLASQGYGATRPIDAAHGEAAWAKNRRVEFVIQERR